MSRLWQLDADLSLHRSWFYPKPMYLIFMVGTVAQGPVSLQVSGFHQCCTLFLYTHYQGKWEKSGIPHKSSLVSETGDESIENYFHCILSLQRAYPLTSHALSLFIQVIPITVLTTPFWILLLNTTIVVKCQFVLALQVR